MTKMTSSKKSRLVIEHLSFAYREKTVLCDVNLSFPLGQNWAIFGPNGAGKSTLMALAARHLQPLVGKVIYDGFKSSDLSYLPQQIEINLLQALSVFEAVAVGLYPKIGAFSALKKEEQDKVEALLGKMDLYNLRDNLLTTLSRGQLQKVLLAQALIKENKCLLLDEPLTALDEQSARNLTSFIFSSQKERTLMCVLHDPALVRAYFSHVVYLNETVRYSGSVTGAPL